jgi:hypothetical protein
VRPYALALGVFPRAGAADKLSFLGPAVAQEMTSALLYDTLGALSTFPVRHRVVFVDGADAVTQQTKLPATWRERPQRGVTGGERIAAAFEDLLGLGAEAILLLGADSPVLPLGPLFDGLMWLLPKGRLLLGAAEGGGLFAVGAAEATPWIAGCDPHRSGLGLLSDDGVVPAAADVSARAKESGLEVLDVPTAYHVDGPAALKRLWGDVQKGAFAPACRKLFERPDVRRFAE